MYFTIYQVSIQNWYSSSNEAPIFIAHWFLRKTTSSELPSSHSQSDWLRYPSFSVHFQSGLCANNICKIGSIKSFSIKTTGKRVVLSMIGCDDDGGDMANGLVLFFGLMSVRENWLIIVSPPVVIFYYDTCVDLCPFSPSSLVTYACVSTFFNIRTCDMTIKFLDRLTKFSNNNFDVFMNSPLNNLCTVIVKFNGQDVQASKKTISSESHKRSSSSLNALKTINSFVNR